ncbi:hemin-degrading factor [Leucothrix sargassi]|nr:hemin-degrading factor [Leucothrix sargassi]
MTTTAKLSWSAYKAANPKVRIRNAAAELGVSELELLSSDLSDDCIRLTPDIEGILKALSELGPVMALTRNDAAVHEVTAAFSAMKMKKQTALFMRPGQDTRFFIENWAFVFAVNENERQSLQFFDSCGVATHKIYLVEDSNKDAYDQLVATFKDSKQVSATPTQTANLEAPNDSDIDIADLRKRWSEIKNVHEGQIIIKSLNNHRLNVFEALGNEYATKLPISVIEDLLTSLSEKNMETMVFVQNDHCVQSFAGPVKRLLRTGPWFNVLDPGFNLHLNTEQLSQVWLIKKPSESGPVHSLNIFDKNNNEVLILTDKRSKGESELAAWTSLMDALKADALASE